MTAPDFDHWLTTDPDDGAVCADHEAPYPCYQCQHEREMERAESMYEEYGHWPKEIR